jgi:hypothetical protein
MIMLFGGICGGLTKYKEYGASPFTIGMIMAITI